MAISFNAFSDPILTTPPAPGTGANAITFASTGPTADTFWRIEGTNLVYTPPGVFSGIITQMVLVDGSGNTLQTVTVDPLLRNAGATGMTATLNAFVAQARAAAEQTFLDWGVTFDHLEALAGGTATAFRVVLLDQFDSVIGFADVTGTGFVPGQNLAGLVRSVTLFDANGDPLNQSATFATPIALNTFNYGLLLVQSRDAAGSIHVPLTAGANTVTGVSNLEFLDGGAGNDALVGGLTGGPFGVSYNSLAGGVGVNVNLALATAQVTGGGGSDTLTRITNIEGSRFNDTLTGSAAANLMFGNEGNDRLLGGAGNDTLVGDGGDDTLVGGAGADDFTGGEGLDFASYAGSTVGVLINLENGGRSGADATGDDFGDVEGIAGSALRDTLTGDLNDNVLEGAGGADDLDGGAQTDGGDTVSYTQSAAAVNVSLLLQGATVAAARAQATGGDATGDRLAGFENILGSAFNDTLTGDTGANRLTGGRGNDLLIGGFGADTLDGGEGIDTASYAASDGEVIVDLVEGASAGDAEGDVLVGIENLIGSGLSDTLFGNSGANRIDGGNGDDVIDGDVGNDTLIGGGNSTEGDTLSYSFVTGGVTVSLALTTAQNTGGSGTDVISGFENLAGSAFDDVLTGSATTNLLEGFAGNDRIFGGAGFDGIFGDEGDDTIEGGAGVDNLFGGEDDPGNPVTEVAGDTASYAGSAAGVRVDLNLQGIDIFQVSAGDASGDQLIGFENIIGSRLADTLTGDANDNILSGGAGADSLVGGDGLDTANYAASTAGVNVDLGEQDAAIAQLGGDAAGDRLFGFENLTGSAFNDTLRGESDIANRIEAGRGNDTLIWTRGSDTLNGGDGNDTVDFLAVDADMTINLLTQTVTGLNTAGTVLIGIEGAIGSEQDDILIASAVGGTLVGGDGADSLEASNFNDTLDGGINSVSERDTLSYDRAGSAVNVNLSLTTAQNTGGSGTDLIRGFEKLEGSSFNDTLTGDALGNEIQGRAGNDLISGLAGNDTLVSGEGNDTLIGGSGADALDGGADTDTVSYAASAAGVSVTLSGGPGVGGDAAGDVLTDIENLIGSRLADTLTGDADDNVIEGGAGADRLEGGGNTAAGDTVSYAASTVAVNIGLAGVAGLGGDAVGDVLSGFENLIGSAFNDTLSGNAGINQLSGGNGNDVFTGLTDDDVVFGGAGTGDTISFASETLSVEVFLAGGFAAFGAGGGNGVSLFGIENATGGSRADRLGGNDLANVLNGGDGDDAIGGGLGNDTLTGGAGIDVVQFDGTANVTVSLSITTAQNTGSGLDVLSGFENLQSDGGNDSLTGSLVANIFFSQGGDDTILGLAGDDEISAGAGDDLLIGGAGADTLRGEGGTDTVSYAGSTAGVRITIPFLAYVAEFGDAAGDTLTGIENFIGSALADTLTGDDTDNVIEGGSGADSLTGGGGTNTLSYAGSNAAVNVNLGANTRTGGHATGDIVSGFVNVLGSAFNDTLTGDAGANRLTGGAGNDVLTGGAGADTLDGGAGTIGDTASYALSTGGVTVNLLLATQGGGSDADGDVLIGIENLIGGVGIDFLTGDAGNNRIDGGAGSDIIEGGVGNDTLIGGTSGTDRDTAFYTNAGAAVTVSLALTTAQNTGGAGTDVISGFEDLNGSLFGDRLTGDAQANIIFANDGNDTVNGGLGSDLLYGGTGADQFVFNTAGGATNVDTMVMFQVGVDEIALENAIFTALGVATGALGDAQFVLGTVATTAAHRIIYDQATGALFYDRDGSGAAVAVQFGIALAGNSASDGGAAGLSVSDFLII